MIKVYSKQGCIQCTATKRTLDKDGISYEVIDISVDDEARDLVLSLGYTSVPVVVTDNDHWSGFRLDRLEELKK